MSNETITLQHRHRVGGPGTNEVVLVGGASYPLDENGCVEVPAEAAEKLLQGKAWRSSWGALRLGVSHDPAAGVVNGARRPRSAAELHAAAAANGEFVDNSPKPRPFVANPAEPPAPEQVAEASGIDEGPADDSTEGPAEASADVAPSAITDAEEIVVSGDMTKAQLLSVAEQAGIAVSSTMTKNQILEAFEAASQ